MYATGEGEEEEQKVEKRPEKIDKTIIVVGWLQHEILMRWEEGNKRDVFQFGVLFFLPLLFWRKEI